MTPAAPRAARPAAAPSPDTPTIAVQKARGKPKLELLEGAGGAAAPGAPPGTPTTPQPLPPPPAAAAPVFGPEGAPQEARRPWTPEEAALAATGAHNVGWTGAFFVRKEITQRELLERAYADPKELDAAAPSIARILDRTPFEPGGSGTLGIIGDVLVTAQAVISLEVRHATLVEEARKRLKEKGAETGPRGKAPPPPAPRRERPPEAPPEPDAGDDGSFRFSAQDLAVLQGRPA